MVPRVPDRLIEGDSSLKAAGGYSLDLQFWWHIEWPQEVQDHTLSNLKYNKDGKLISINVLEYATVIINYAAATVVLNDRIATNAIKHKYPVVLIRADNRTAESWTMKASSSSIIGKALMRLQCCLMINNQVGINVEYIKGIDNIIADYISRYKKETNELYSFSNLTQVFPELTCCHRFHPRKELLSMIYELVLNASIMDPLSVPKKLGHVEIE